MNTANLTEVKRVPISVPQTALEDISPRNSPLPRVTLETKKRDEIIRRVTKVLQPVPQKEFKIDKRQVAGLMIVL